MDRYDIKLSERDEIRIVKTEKMGNLPDYHSVLTIKRKDIKHIIELLRIYDNNSSH